MRTHSFWPKVKTVGGKKRPVTIMRATLREIGVQARKLTRAGRYWRGQLRRTTSQQADLQMEIGRRLDGIRAGKAQVRRYIASLGMRAPGEPS